MAYWILSHTSHMRNFRQGLSKNHFDGDSSIIAIASSLSFLRRLQRLDLSRDYIGFFTGRGTEALARVLPLLSNLQFLNLADNYIGSIDRLSGVNLVGNITQLSALRSLYMGQRQPMPSSQMARLRQYWNRRNRDTDVYSLQTVEDVQEYLKSLSNETTSVLLSGQIPVPTDEMLQTLMKGLKTLSHLNELDLSNNYIIEGWGFNFTSFFNELSHFTTLQSLNLAGNGLALGGSGAILALGKSLQYHKTLRILNILDNYIGANRWSQGPMAIARALPFLLNLESLYLSGDGGSTWDNNSTRTLAKALPHLTKLRTFVFSNAGFGDSENATVEFISALPSVPILTHLDLSNNNIGAKGDAGAAVLAQVLPSLKNLKTLDLRNNPLGTTNSTGMEALLDALSPLLCRGTTVYTQNTGLSLVPWSQASVDLQAVYSAQIQKACEDHQCFGTPVESSNVTCSASSPQRKEVSFPGEDFTPFNVYTPVTSSAVSLKPPLLFRIWDFSSSPSSQGFLRDGRKLFTRKAIAASSPSHQPSTVASFQDLRDEAPCPVKEDPTYSSNSLFLISMGKSTLTTFVPEMVREILEQGGAPKPVIHMVGTLTQVGMVLYTTTSYLPTAIGMATHKGLTHIGASAEVATGIGNTAAIVTSLASGDVVTPTNLIASMGGGIVGNRIAVQAKNTLSSWLRKNKTVERVKSKIQSSWASLCDFLDCFEG